MILAPSFFNDLDPKNVSKLIVTEK